MGYSFETWKDRYLNRGYKMRFLSEQYKETVYVYARFRNTASEINIESSNRRDHSTQLCLESPEEVEGFKAVWEAAYADYQRRLALPEEKED